MSSKKSFEQDQEIHQKDFGTIVLYRRPDHKIPRWQCRINVRGSTGYEIRSCKSTDKTAAYLFAEELYRTLLLRQQQSGTIHSKSFNSVFKEWLKNIKSTNKSEQLIRGYEQRTEKYALKYWSNTPIDQITEQSVIEFIQWRRENFDRRNPAETTIIRELAPLKQIFTYAYKKKYIQERIEFPRLSIKGKNRPHFTRQEYNRLIIALRKSMNDARKNRPQSFRYRFYLYYYVLVLANSGVRIGELRQLRWRDKEKAPSELNKDGICLWVRGKTSKRQVIPQPNTKSYLDRIFDFRTKELGEQPEEDEIVFCHRTGVAVDSYKKGFTTLLEANSLRTDIEGNNHTLYSLRHTYATLRLEEGAPHYLIAQNMGTSVQMLEKHYAKLTMASVADQITRMRKR